MVSGELLCRVTHTDNEYQDPDNEYQDRVVLVRIFKLMIVSMSRCPIVLEKM
jgi:hypothetical protein